MQRIAKLFVDIEWDDLTHQEKETVKILINDGYLIVVQGTIKKGRMCA